jgi:hypothetical protein
MKIDTIPLYYAAAATTAITGNIHLIVASNIMQFSIIMEYFSLLQE